MLSITKIFRFEMAHALHRYDGACANIHGHSYRLEVTITGPIVTDAMHPKCGMIMDFKDLNEIVQQSVLSHFDHALILNSAVRHSETGGYPELSNELQKHFGNILLVDYQPTNENLLQDFAQRITAQLPQNIKLHKLRLYETESAYGELRITN